MHLSTLEAYILDLDGVVTHTAQLHSVAWKRLFDEYREARKRCGEPEFQPFDIHDDYLRYVDGKTRVDGVRSFLETRGIRLPEGRPDDPADFETVNGLGNLKNTYFDLELKRKGPEVFPDAIEALGRWRRLGFKTAIASSSKNCEEILRLAGLTGLFDARVDGTHIERWGMPGKPAPDIFLAAARLLGVEPSRAAVLEDAISGVQAARAGHFGLVVGIARFGHPERLKTAGADIVVSELTAVPVPKQARRPEPGANP